MLLKGNQKEETGERKVGREGRSERGRWSTSAEMGVKTLEMEGKALAL